MNRMFTAAAASGAAIMLATTMGCTSGAPLTPTLSSGGSGAAADGSTLKVTAPPQVSPASGETISGQIALVIGASSGELGGRTLSYEFEIQTEAGVFARSTTVNGTTSIVSGLSPNTAYRWRARGVLEGATGPWSAVRTFRTPAGPPGCINGLLLDPKAYFFHVINRREGDPTSLSDSAAVLRGSTIPAGLPPGQKPAPGAPHYGITQQVNSSGEPRGVLFLPTETPEALGFFTEEYQVVVVAPGGAQVWGWSRRGGATYVPRACP